MKKILLALLMVGTLFGCATSTDETGSGPTEEPGNGPTVETNTPADYFGLDPYYEEYFQLNQGDEDYKFVNFYTEEEKELLNKKFAKFYVDDDDDGLEENFKTMLIATSKDGKHKYDPTKIKIKNIKNVTWYDIGDYGFADVDLEINSRIKEPYEDDGVFYYDVYGSYGSYSGYDIELNNEENCQYLINNKSFFEDLIRKQEDIYKLKYDLKTFKVKEGFQDADFLDEEKNPYLKWVNVSIPVYFNFTDDMSFDWICGDAKVFTNAESLGWALYQENGIIGDVNKIKEAILAGKYYRIQRYGRVTIQNAKIENDEIYITQVLLQRLYYLVTLEYENLEYDVIIEINW